MQSHQREPRAGFDRVAFQASERARARSLLESLKEAPGEIREGVDPNLLDRERSLEKEMNLKAIRHSRLRANKNSEAEEVAKEIDRLAADYAEVKGQIRANSPRYAALTQPQLLSLTEIQQGLLDDHTLLLEYMLGDERSYVWAVSRQDVASYQLPGRLEIEESARRVYSLLTQTELPTKMEVSPGDDQATALSRLSESLLAPLKDKLGSKRLLIVADGFLQHIPFQALTLVGPTNSGALTGPVKPRPLVMDHEIIYEPSASALALVLSAGANRQQARKSVAILADPVFESADVRIKTPDIGSLQAAVGTSPASEVTRALRDVGVNDGQIPRLLSSREEAEAIMSVAPWRTVFKAVDFDANRTTAMGEGLGQYRVVHFATHALLDNEHPELSGIVLSLVNEKGLQQDGFLRLHDIYNLRLPVDLVVLSACQTGLGKDVKGEGLIGLTRGFMYAGASGVVASLWKVDDEATAELMKHFYAGLFEKGLTPAASLRDAQLAVRQQRRWQEPYYWAGFVIQGQYDHGVASGLQRPGLKIVGLVALSGILILIITVILKRRFGVRTRSSVSV